MPQLSFNLIVHEFHLLQIAIKVTFMNGTKPITWQQTIHTYNRTCEQKAIKGRELTNGPYVQVTSIHRYLLTISQNKERP